MPNVSPRYTGFGYDEVLLEILPVFILVAAVAAVGVVFWVAVRWFRGVRHRLTRPELRNRALEESERLFQLVEEREAARPEQDPIIKDHEFPHRRVTVHDEETQAIYIEKHLPRVADLREQFAERHVRNRTLDDLYESVENDADIRTVSTALAEMSKRLG